MTAAAPPAAAKELTFLLQQIAADGAPSAAALEVWGWPWQTAEFLAQQIRSGVPDLGVMRDCGIIQATAITIACAIAERHARKAAAVTPVTQIPVTPKAAATPEQLDGFTALSQLHTLFSEGESGQPVCLTKMTLDGWSLAFAREFKSVVDASLTQQRTAR